MEATHVPTATEENRRQRLKGKYVVLREVTDAGELAEVLAKGDAQVFVVISKDVSAKTSDAAIRQIAITDEEVATGRYVAPPASSFRTAVVKSVPQLFMD